MAGLWACTAPQIFLRLYAWILLFDIHMYQCHLCMVTNAIIYLCYKLYVMCGRLPWHQLMSLWIKNKNKFHVRFCHQVLQGEKMPECSQICLRASLLTANAEFIGKKTTASFCFIQTFLKASGKFERLYRVITFHFWHHWSPRPDRIITYLVLSHSPSLLYDSIYMSWHFNDIIFSEILILLKRRE